MNIDEGSTLTLNVRGTKVVLTRNSMACGAKPVSTATPLTSFEMLIDRTSIETFANEGEASMSKCFLASESGLSARATGGRVSIKRLSLVHLKSAWTEK